jgi:hypothetical protein
MRGEAVRPLMPDAAYCNTICTAGNSMPNANDKLQLSHKMLWNTSPSTPRMDITRFYKGSHPKLIIEDGWSWLSVGNLPNQSRSITDDRWSLVISGIVWWDEPRKEDPEHSVAVGDGKGGYMISLGVFHELHCLVRPFQLLWATAMPALTYSSAVWSCICTGSNIIHTSFMDLKRTLTSLITLVSMRHNHVIRSHWHPLDHCLEAIRLSLMCAGSLATYSFQRPSTKEKVQLLEDSLYHEGFEGL